jgi:peptidoglycan/xylan/chitin deacetylase (PgdA/CDA1 family)
MNKINKNLIFSIVLLLLTLITPATAITTYTCCKNFTTNSGNIIVDTNNISNWTLTPTGTSSIGNDTLHAIDGDTAVYWNTGNISPVQARQTYALNLSLNQNDTISYWAYSSDWDKVSSIKLLIYNDFPGSQPRIEWIVTNISFSSSASNDSGWQYFTYNTALMTKYSPYNISNKTKDLRFLIYPVNTSVSANVTIDKITFGYRAKPKFFWDFDDGRMNISTLVYPVLEANNQKGTIFVTINEINLTTAAINLSQMHMLYNNDWDVSSHAMNHVDLSVLSNASLQTELVSSHDYLYNQGFVRSAPVIAYPVGYYNDNMINYVKQTYLIGRTVNEAYFSGNIQAVDTLQYRQTDSSIRDVAGIIAEINKTIARNGTMHLLMHNVQNDQPYYALNYNLTNLTEISNYLSTRTADIDVIVYSDLLIEHTSTTNEFDTTGNILIDAFTAICSILAIFITFAGVMIKAVVLCAIVYIVIKGIY